MRVMSSNDTHYPNINTFGARDQKVISFSFSSDRGPGNILENFLKYLSTVWQERLYPGKKFGKKKYQ